MTHPNEAEGTGPGFPPGQPAAAPPPAASPEPSTSTYPAPAAPYPASAAPYPASAAPYPFPPTGAPGRPKLSAWVWVLAGLSAVLLVVAGLVGFVYVGARGANADRIAERDAKIAELQAELQRLQDQRQELEQERDDALAELHSTQEQVDQQQACPDALIAFNDAPIGSAEEDAAFAAMLTACNASL